MIESDAYFNILSDDDDDNLAINGGTITSTDAIRIKRGARKYRILSKCAMLVSLAISFLFVGVLLCQQQASVLGDDYDEDGNETMMP
jgi:hypothetical protein